MAKTDNNSILSRYLIVGGGIAGTTAAEALRQGNPTASITIVSDEPYPLYSRLMISKPYFILGRVPFDHIWLKKESWYRENNITLLAGKTAVHLDTAKKTVTLDDGSKIHYEKLLLALGGCARPCGIPGSDMIQGVTYLRTLDQAKAILEAMKSAQRAIAVGSGFISFEICETLKIAGLEVTLVMREPYYWYPLFDEGVGKLIERALEKNGVKVMRNAEIVTIEGKEKLEAVALKSGERIACDIAVMGIGLQYPVGWVLEAGVETGRGIITNEYLETNIADIYAAGDIAEYHDLILEERVQLGNWVNAQTQGKIAAANMMGERQAFRMVSFYTTQAFGVTISFVGDVRRVPDRQIISRGSPDKNSCASILVKDGEIIGATLVNRTQELGIISKLIEKDINVASHLDTLADARADLSSLLSW